MGTVGALRPQTPDQRPSVSGHQSGETIGWEERTTSACSAGNTKVQKASGPRKPGNNPIGESSLSPWDFPGFPRMQSIRIGRFQRSGQKQNGDKFGLFFQINSGKPLACYVKLFPQVWVQGGHLPGGVRGKAPPFSSLSSPNFHFMRNPCLTKYLRLNKPARSCIMAVARNRADREEAYVRKNRRAARRGPTGSRD